MKELDRTEAAGLNWARLEVLRSKNHWMPMRSLEHDEDLEGVGPERRVKFSVNFRFLSFLCFKGRTRGNFPNLFPYSVIFFR